MCTFLFSFYIKIKCPRGANRWKSAQILGVKWGGGVSDNIRDSLIEDHSSGHR